MRRKNLTDRLPGWAGPVFCAILAAAALWLNYSEPTRVLSLFAGAVIVYLLVTGDLTRLRNWPTVFLMGYAAFSMLTIFWAMSGKFHLTQYSKIFIAAALYLAVAAYGRPGRAFARGVMGALAGMAAALSAVGLLGAALPPLRELLRDLFPGSGQAFVYSGRLWSVFGNSNIESALFAMGVFLSIGLLCDAEGARQRGLWAAALFLNAVSLLLGFSMGALAFFAVAVALYLIFAGKGRLAALLRMLEGAVPALVFGVLMVHFYGTGSGAAVAALLVLGTAATVVLELKVTDKLRAIFEPQEKLVFGVLIGLGVLAAVYAAAAFNVSAPYAFGGDVTRYAMLAPGEHTLSVEADGDMTVLIESYTEGQVVSRAAPTALYEGPADGARFVVPDNSYATDFTFRAAEGTTLRRAVIDGSKSLMLRHALLPGFAAGRLEGGVLLGRHNSLERLAFMRDGLKLFARSPIGGNGVGSFETGVSSVQEYHYATRYVHNHYVQILLEDGIIGFALFLAALVSMAAALWKKRRESAEGELRWLYPALCAEFAMAALHMLWDAFMSIFPVLCCIYTVYGLIAGLFAEPITAGEPEQQKKKKPARKQSDAPARIALMLLPIFYVLSICGNLYAQNTLSTGFSSTEEAYAAMERIVRYDLYEKNDIKLTYLLTEQEDENGEKHLEQANIYAEELSKVQSNRLPGYLVAYYYNTQQYARAIDEAMLGATYSASDADQWNTIVDYLKQGFIDAGPASPLLQENGGELLDKLLEYAAMLDEYNANSPNPLVLSDESNEFFEKIDALDAVRGDWYAMLAILQGEG